MSGLVRKRRLIEWCRPIGALPSRMRDRGGDIPAGCEVCGERPALSRAHPWRKAKSPDALTHRRNAMKNWFAKFPLM